MTDPTPEPRCALCGARTYTQLCTCNPMLRDRCICGRDTMVANCPVHGDAIGRGRPMSPQTLRELGELLVATLRFYADPDSYEPRTRRVRPVIDDGGLRARAILTAELDRVWLQSALLKNREDLRKQDQRSEWQIGYEIGWKAAETRHAWDSGREGLPPCRFTTRRRDDGGDAAFCLTHGVFHDSTGQTS